MSSEAEQVVLKVPHIGRASVYFLLIKKILAPLALSWAIDIKFDGTLR